MNLKSFIPNLKQLLWLAPFASFMAGYCVLSLLYGAQAIRTPSVLGSNLTQAFTTLSVANLNPRLLASKDMPELPDSTVLSQTPAPNTKIKPQQTVYLVISSRPGQQKAPNLIGKSLQEITPLLKNVGIRNKIYTIAGNYPKEYCISQFPSPGTMLKDNKVITYLCAGGSKPVLMPNLKNRSVPEVQDFLSLPNIPVTIMHYPPQPPGHRCHAGCTITDQRPLAGSLINLDEHKGLQVQLQAR